jgi:predicted RNase H-like HicB family nuclease
LSFDYTEEAEKARELKYFAVFEPSNDGGYGVYFPDLPGCASYGKTYAEAEEMAKEALSLHIYGMEKDDEPIPAPKDRAKLEIDGETATGYVVSPIKVYPFLHP